MKKQYVSEQKNYKGQGRQLTRKRIKILLLAEKRASTGQSSADVPWDGGRRMVGWAEGTGRLPERRGKPPSLARQIAHLC